MNRRDFLAGNLSGLVVGTGAVWGLSKATQPPRPTTIAVHTHPIPSPLDIAEASDARPYLKVSFAQQGEDLVLKNVLDTLRIPKPSYIDVGAWHPIIGSNTYLFYLLAGSRGVLVEPNPAFVSKLRSVRKEDVVVAAGIGTGGATEADYYVIAGDGQRNTFSREQVDVIMKQEGPRTVQEVRKMPLVDINRVLAGHFKEPPALFSVDTEGMDLAILESLDFTQWRPRVFCVETSMVNTGRTDPRIIQFMKSKGFIPGGGTLINTVFVDERDFG